MKIWVVHFVYANPARNPCKWPVIVCFFPTTLYGSWDWSGPCELETSQGEASFQQVLPANSSLHSWLLSGKAMFNEIFLEPLRFFVVCSNPIESSQLPKKLTLWDVKAGWGSCSSDYMWHKHIGLFDWYLIWCDFCFTILERIFNNSKCLNIFSCIAPDHMLHVLSPLIEDKIKTKAAFFSLWIQLCSWQGGETKKNNKNRNFWK